MLPRHSYLHKRLCIACNRLSLAGAGIEVPPVFIVFQGVEAGAGGQIAVRAEQLSPAPVGVLPGRLHTVRLQKDAGPEAVFLKEPILDHAHAVPRL